MPKRTKAAPRGRGPAVSYGTIGSLFSGIGGLELGLERAGLGPVIWQAESDPFCQRVLETHWPEVTRYDEVQAIDGLAERPWLICGGFPCQDISLAGAGAGIEGARSGLWAEYARIAGALGPEFIVVENVAALANRGLDRVLGDLATLGYDACWDCIPAAAVGAPHRRDRLFVVARRVADASGQRLSGALKGEERTGLASPRSASHQALANPDHNERERRQSVPGERGQEGAHAEWRGDWPPAPDDMHAWGRVSPESQPALCRLADGLPSGLDQRRARLRALGNSVVPQVAEVIGRAIVAATRDGRGHS